MRRIILIVSCIVFTSVFIMFISGLFYVPLTKTTPVVDTKLKIRDINFLLYFGASEHVKEAAAYLDRRTNYDAYASIRNMVIAFSEKSYIKFPKNIPKDDILSDLWGNHLNIRWADDLPENVQIPPNSSPFRIWSSGANGTNEYGANDDITYDGAWMQVWPLSKTGSIEKFKREQERDSIKSRQTTDRTPRNSPGNSE